MGATLLKWQTRICAVLVGGIGLGLSSSEMPLWSGLAWISLIPLFYCIFAERTNATSLHLHTAFGWGAITGLLLQFFPWAWMLDAAQSMSHAGRWGGVAFVGAFSLFGALCVGIFAVLATLFARYLAKRCTPGLQSFLFPWITASLWVLIDYATPFLVGASGLPVFPSLGYSQWKNFALIQIASITGVFGVSFLIVLINASLAVALLTRNRRILLPALGLLMLVWTGGSIRVWMLDHDPHNLGAPIRIAVLQGDIPPFPKFERQQGSFLAHRYLDLTKKANESRPNLVIWTETAVPWALEDGDDLVETALHITEPSQACHIVGTLFRAPDAPTNTFHNTAFLVLPDGQVTSQYHKMRLIAMVEEAISLPGVSHPICALSGTNQSHLAPGPALSLLNSPYGRIGLCICNENTYPDMTRKLIRNNADLLVTIGNDGWCKGTAGQIQHFSANPFRAVEAGRDLVVANNSGVSGIIDALGRVQTRSEIHQPTCLTGLIHRRNLITFYARHGDLLMLLCSAICVIPIFIKNRKPS